VKQRTAVILAASLGALLALVRAGGLDPAWLIIGMAVGGHVGLGVYAIGSGKVTFVGRFGPPWTYTGASARIVGAIMVLAGVGFMLLYASAH
jgi:hypothetical protein